MEKPPRPQTKFGRVAGNVRIFQVLGIRDFRLFWIGAFISFTGGWIQNVAQGHFVYELTHSESKLAMVSFFWSAPVFLLGLFTGTFSDRFDRRKVLIWCQILMGSFALFLAATTFLGRATYTQVIVIAFLNGLVSSIEMPARQSVISRVVPPEQLSAAVPVSAMTFNGSRILGPAIGGLMLASFGVAACYLINGLSYLALVFAMLAIHADLHSHHREPGSLRDLIKEGALYTLREPRLRTLFVLEGFTAVCGIAYLPLMPAYVSEVLRVPEPKRALGYAFTSVGIGAIAGLILVTQLADWRGRGRLIQASMGGIAVGLLILSLTQNVVVAHVGFVILGAGTIIQFNGTNALFQTLSPDRLRGRTLAMHIWVLNGLSPFGVVLFGWMATASRLSRDWHYALAGVNLSMRVGAILMAIGTLVAMLLSSNLSDLEPAHDEQSLV